MEQKVFRRPAVAGILVKDFVEARLHTDTGDKLARAHILELQKELSGSVANPFYVTMDPRSGKVLGKYAGATLADDSPFVEFLTRSIELGSRQASAR